MSGFCITSLIQDNADFVLSLLQKAGLEAAQPSQRDASMTFGRWHEQVLTLPIEFYVDSFNEKTDAGDGQSLQVAGWDASRDMGRDIGRLWEQLASDVFIANMNSLMWGWADARSADLLPFWAGFDPQLKFVLVTCSPERYLANFIETSDKPFEPKVLLARWQAYHKALLQFSRLYPKRCVITSFEDVLMSPQGLVDTCNETFFTQLGRVGLSALRGFPVGQMAALVATKFATPTKDQESLERELRVSLTPLKVTMHAPRLTNNAAGDSKQGQSSDGHESDVRGTANSGTGQNLNSDDDVTIVDFMGDDDLPASNDPVEIIAHYRRILAEVKRDQPASRPRGVGDVMDVQYRDSRDAGSGQYQSDQDLQAKLKDTEEENDLLLAQLHQVQEELENYFLKHQEVSGQYEALQARFQKLAARVPGFVEVDRVEIVKHNKTKSLSTEWRVEGLESGDRTLPELNFRTFVEDGVACLEFKRADDGSTALKRWPAQEDEFEAVVAAVGDEVTGPHRARVLQSISTSDWLMVKAINALLVKELDKPQLVKLPRGFNAKGLGTAVTELQSHLNALPPVLHFDEIRLKSYQEEPEYEYLWFGFTNVLFGDKHIPSFEFRFASVNVPSGSFGSNPRLEFHEAGSKAAFDGWFKESEDDYGAKLELRFAQPGAMDMDVWAKIEQGDKELIAALIAQLPMFIDQLRSSNSRLMRGWDDWKALAETVHNYFLTCTASLLDEAGIEDAEPAGDEEKAEENEEINDEGDDAYLADDADDLDSADADEFEDEFDEALDDGLVEDEEDYEGEEESDEYNDNEVMTASKRLSRSSGRGGVKATPSKTVGRQSARQSARQSVAQSAPQSAPQPAHQSTGSSTSGKTLRRTGGRADKTASAAGSGVKNAARGDGKSVGKNAARGAAGSAALGSAASSSAGATTGRKTLSRSTRRRG